MSNEQAGRGSDVTDFHFAGSVSGVGMDDGMSVTITIPVGPILLAIGLLWIGWWCWLFIEVFREARAQERQFSRQQRDSYLEHIKWRNGIAFMASGLIAVVGGVLLW